MNKLDFTKIAVSGFSSEVGKTTLLCELLPFFPGWEAIKLTRGHYRSCGKDPRACCVSHLLTDHPVINSGRDATYEPGKDTGRYWEAGAANVHWVVVTNEQVAAGINLALDRVRAPGVLIEGTGFLASTPVDFGIMVASAAGGKIKTTARQALPGSSALYLSGAVDDPAVAGNRIAESHDHLGLGEAIRKLPVYSGTSLPQLAERIRTIHEARVRR